jgi:hypothetical protein
VAAKAASGSRLADETAGPSPKLGWQPNRARFRTNGERRFSMAQFGCAGVTSDTNIG